MTTPKFLYQAAVIASHKKREVLGRTRLQKTIKLLQRLGFPTDYAYSIYFYGPYSEGVQSDTELLKKFKIVEEIAKPVRGGYPTYVLKCVKDKKTAKWLPDIKTFVPAIAIMEKTSKVVLELAATYDAFIEQGASDEKALAWLKLKKGSKCTKHNLEAAFQLLDELRLLKKRPELKNVIQ